MAVRQEDKPAARMVVELGASGRIKEGFPKWLAVALAFCGILLAIFFNYSVYPFGFVIDDTVYVYWTLAAFVPCVILNSPVREKLGMERIQWYDWLLAGIVFGIFIYFGIRANEIGLQGWGSRAPFHALVLSAIIFALMLSLSHRIYGTVFFIIVLFFSFLPMFAEKLPGVLSGVTYPWNTTLTQIVLGCEGIIGIPMRVAAKIIISFMPFMLAMLIFGGGRFLTNLALSQVGRFRGAGAKVAVVASAMLASMTGGPSVNVITTGMVTIPLMKRAGYPPHYAGAIEACASTGGTITPPIMGTAAFIIASFLLIPYWQVAVAAAIPAILYYVSLFAQVDLYAKKAGLRGEPLENLPKFWDTLKQGWFFIPPFLVFVYCLLGPRIEAKSGYFAVATLFVLYYCSGGWQRLKGFPTDMVNILLSVAKTTAVIIVLLAIVGHIIASVSITGMSLSLTNGLVMLSGGNIFLLLIIGAIASFILGMGMGPVSLYCIVAILLAPALVQVGINPLAAHLFCLYWGMLSFITPPVAIASMLASKLAGAGFFKTGVQSVRIGVGLFILPFFFVLSPVLVLQEFTFTKFFLDFVTCCSGLVILAMGLEGSIYGIKGEVGIPMRVLLFAAGFLLAVPGWQTDIYGLILAAVVIALYLLRRRVRPHRAAPA